MNGLEREVDWRGVYNRGQERELEYVERIGLNKNGPESVE